MVSEVAHETSSATTALVVRYVRSRGGQPAVDALLRTAGVPYTEDELCDPSRWFGYEDRIRLFEATVDVLGDPDATFDLGASAARNGMNPSVVLVVRSLGSPRQVFRQLPRAVAKFTTTSSMEVVEVGPVHATMRYRLHEGYVHSRLDCRYAQGLFSAIPTVFDLAPARVVHDECEADGFPACLYHVTWDRRHRAPWGRRRTDATELAALRGQLRALQSAASDLVGSDDLTVALERIVARAGAAVVAPAYLCVVDTPDGRGPLVHSAGLDPAREAELTARLQTGTDIGPNAIVVDVATARRHHGRLAALYPEGQRGPGSEEEDLLEAYAGHAAAALDQLWALEASRRGESRARDLLKLAHELAEARDARAVAEIVAAALPRIVGSRRSSVMLWDPLAGELRAAAAAGMTTRQRAALLGSAVRPDETPELVEMLARREPSVIEQGTASPVLRQLFLAVGVERLVAVPLVAADTLLGVATVGWTAGTGPPGGVTMEVIERLSGVAEQAAAALQNARLLGAVRHQTLHDSLTGLPNRVRFVGHLDAALRRATDRSVAVLFCDLDRFKVVNDTLGHAAGDELLRQIARRLAGTVRDGDLVARLSGDEFAVVAEVRDVPEATALARGIIACFDGAFRVDGRELRATTSVGIALHRGTGGDGDRLLRSADAAMYAAKQRGRNQIVTAGLAASVAGGSLGAELQQALDDDQLRVHYQAVVARQGGGYAGAGRVPRRVVGAEALIRWEHPRLGLLSPAAFLPLAEERGLAVELDLWVLRTAAGELGVALAAERAAGRTAEGSSPYLAVNVSAATLLDDRLPATVRAVRREHDLAPGQLVIEVIESRSLVDLPGVVQRLTELRSTGVRVSLDDFGTGYSTLTWLHGLPIDQIKIDRSFVAPLPDDAAAAGLIRGLVALARELGLEVVAEGVESDEQLDAIEFAGCDRVQGFLFGRPEPSLARSLSSMTTVR